MGIYLGDLVCFIFFILRVEILDEIEWVSVKIVLYLGVVGLLNI